MVPSDQFNPLNTKHFKTFNSRQGSYRDGKLLFVIIFYIELSNGTSGDKNAKYYNGNAVGFQSFGSKYSSNMKQNTHDSKFTVNQGVTINNEESKLKSKLASYAQKAPKHPVDQQMHNSIEEFLEETKSIENDLFKLKQLSIEKKHSELLMLDPRTQARTNNYSSIRKQPPGNFSILNSAKKDKQCRTADNSLERDNLETNLASKKVLNAYAASIQNSESKPKEISRNAFATPLTNIPSKFHHLLTKSIDFKVASGLMTNRGNQRNSRDLHQKVYSSFDMTPRSQLNTYLPPVEGMQLAYNTIGMI
jgi:hypothetical protein